MAPRKQKQQKQQRQPRRVPVSRVTEVDALFAIATAIERHSAAIESVRDAILEASGKMPPPEFTPPPDEPVETGTTDDEIAQGRAANGAGDVDEERLTTDEPPREEQA